MAREKATDRSKVWISLLILLGVLVVVAIVALQPPADREEPGNPYGATTPGANLSPDASPAPLEGAEGAAGLVTPAPAPDTAQQQEGADAPAR